MKRAETPNDDEDEESSEEDSVNSDVAHTELVHEEEATPASEDEDVPKPPWLSSWTVKVESMFDHNGRYVRWVNGAFAYYYDWTLIDVATGFPSIEYQAPPCPESVPMGTVRWTNSKRWTVG